MVVFYGVNEPKGGFRIFQFLAIHACNSYRLVLQQLKAFEEALHQHIHLENNIVFPRSIKMEAKLREQP